MYVLLLTYSKNNKQKTQQLNKKYGGWENGTNNSMTWTKKITQISQKNNKL